MKAIIISHERGGSYVMNHEGCFEFVRGFASRPIGEEIDFAAAPRMSFARAAGIAACFAVVLLLGGFGWMRSAESYSVYVDVNPSVELVFNNLNRLKAANPLNADGMKLLADVKLKGAPGDVVVSLIQKVKEEGLIGAGQPNVLITVAARGGKSPEAYEKLIISALEDKGLQNYVTVEVCDKDFRVKAEQYGVSPGKLKLAERLYAADPSLDLEGLLKALKDMPVKDLLEDIRQAEGKGAPAAEKDEDGLNVNAGPENSNGNDEQPSNENAGPGNNSGNDEQPSNENAGPGNNSGNAAQPGGNSGAWKR